MCVSEIWKYVSSYIHHIPVPESPNRHYYSWEDILIRSPSCLLHRSLSTRWSNLHSSGQKHCCYKRIVPEQATLKWCRCVPPSFHYWVSRPQVVLSFLSMPTLGIHSPYRWLNLWWSNALYVDLDFAALAWSVWVPPLPKVEERPKHFSGWDFRKSNTCHFCSLSKFARVINCSYEESVRFLIFGS